jgi:diacylglycerol kinase (ATP)
VKLCVIFNPAARGQRAERFRREFGSVSAHTFKATSAPGSARTLATEAVNEGFDTIAAAGGDGTVNEVLNGIGDVPGAFERVRLGVLPLGTVNVFARELRIPLSFAGSWQALLAGNEITIDLPQAEYSEAGKPARRYFAQFAGAGWDSRAVELVAWELKKRIGKYAYVVAGLKAWLGKLPPIEAANGTMRAAGPLALVGNGRFYGGEWAVFPKADLQDGLLEVTVFPNLSWAGVLRSVGGLLTNSLYTFGGAHHFRAESLELSSAASTWLQLDGENVGQLPARLTVRRRALRVVCPQHE